MFEDIDVSSIQGLEASNYADALALLNNGDEYDYEILVIPGVTIQNGSSAVASAISTVTNRGDAIAVVDTRNYGSTLNQVITGSWNTRFKLRCNILAMGSSIIKRNWKVSLGTCFNSNSWSIRN
jgi:hypothetical protein